MERGKSFRLPVILVGLFLLGNGLVWAQYDQRNNSDPYMGMDLRTKMALEERDKRLAEERARRGATSGQTNRKGQISVKQPPKRQPVKQTVKPQPIKQPIKQPTKQQVKVQSTPPKSQPATSATVKTKLQTQPIKGKR